MERESRRVAPEEDAARSARAPSCDPAVAGSARSAIVGLIRPPVVLNPRSLGTIPPVPPLGLAYLAGTLRDAGHSVRIIDAAGLALDDQSLFTTGVGTLARIGLGPDETVALLDPTTQIVGITVMFTHDWPEAQRIARAVRARLPDAWIIVGGETATACWREMLRTEPGIDLCVLGEGEGPLIDVVDAIVAGRSPDGIAGVATRRGLGRGATTEALAVRRADLSSLSRPAWDLVPLENYWAHPPHGVDRGRSIPMLASRGCPYSCTFCSSPQMWTTRYKVRHPEDIVDEMEDLVERYAVQNVNFHDLTAITKRRWTLELCDEICRRGLEISWQLPIGTRSEALDREVLEALNAAGCRNITYAPESGSEAVLEAMDKRVELDRLLESVRIAKEVGLSPHMNVIIGHPAERRSDLARTFSLALRAARAGCDDLSPIHYSPYPGSADFESLHPSGWTFSDDLLYGGLSRSARSGSWTPHIRSAELRVAQLAMLTAFYAIRFAAEPRRLRTLGRRREEHTKLQEMLRGRRTMAALRRGSRQTTGIPRMSDDPSHASAR